MHGRELPEDDRQLTLWADVLLAYYEMPAPRLVDIAERVGRSRSRIGEIREELKAVGFLDGPSGTRWRQGVTSSGERWLVVMGRLPVRPERDRNDARPACHRSSAE